MTQTTSPPQAAPAPTETQAALDALVERAEERYHDVKFAATRAWKEAHPGRKAVGCMPVWFPRELIHAAGMLPVTVVGGGTEEAISRAADRKPDAVIAAPIVVTRVRRATKPTYTATTTTGTRSTVAASGP